jgi:hypothetical protein
MNRTTLPTLAAVAALAACSHDRTAATHAAQPADQTARDSATADESRPVAALADGHVSRDELDVATRDLQQSLTRLVALEIVDVGALVDNMPSGAMNCYGPCEDDPHAQAWMQDQVTKIDRFHALVDTTEELVRTKKATATSTEAQTAVKALVALQLVELEVKGE